MLKKTSGSNAFDSDDEAAFVDALSTLLRRRRNLDLLHRQRHDAHVVTASSCKRRCPSSAAATARRASLRKCREWLAEEITRHEWSKGLWPPAPSPPPPPPPSPSVTGGDPSQPEEHPPPQGETDSCSAQSNTCSPADSRATPSKRARAEDRPSACSSSDEEDSSASDAASSSSSSAATEKHVFSMCAKKSPPPRKQKRKKREMTSYEATLLRARKKLLAAKEKATKQEKEKPKEKHAASTASTASEDLKSQKETISSKAGSSSKEASSMDSKRGHAKKYHQESKDETEFELNRKRILTELAAKGTPWPFTGTHNKFTKLTLPMLTQLFPTALNTPPARTPVPAKEAPNKTVSSATTHAYHRPRLDEEVEMIQELKFPKLKDVSVFRGGTPVKKSDGCGDRSRGVPARILRPSGEGPTPVAHHHHTTSAPHPTLHSRVASLFNTPPTHSRADPFPKVVALLPKQARLRPFRPSSPKLPALFQKWARISGASAGSPASAAHASLWRRVAGTNSTYGLRSDRRVRKSPNEPVTYPRDYGLQPHVPVYRPPARHGTRRKTSPTNIHTQ